MRSLSISVLGGTGFVGSALVTRLIRDGHRVEVLTRNRERHRALTVLPGLELVEADVHDPSALAEAFRGADVVINLVGVLNERGGARFARVHTELARKVVVGCRSAAVPRLLQMSALGAADKAPSRYLRSKAAAEQVIREDTGDLAWTIFQPSIIVGADGGVVRQFAGLLGMFPALPLARGNCRFAPVVIDDVVEALCASLEARETFGAVLPLCGPDVLTLVELARLIAAAGGWHRAVFALPDALGWLQSAVLGLVPGSPLTLDNFHSLSLDSVCTENGFGRLGITPRSARAVIPGYLGAHAPAVRFAAYRRAAGVRIDEP